MQLWNSSIRTINRTFIISNQKHFCHFGRIFAQHTFLTNNYINNFSNAVLHVLNIYICFHNSTLFVFNKEISSLYKVNVDGTVMPIDKIVI